MTAGRYDIACEQGATFSLPLTWTAAGQPVDLTGYSARMQVRAGFETAAPFLTLTTENGGISLAAGGKITLAAPATATAALAAQAGVYDLELVAPGGRVTRLLQGNFTVSREVTR